MEEVEQESDWLRRETKGNEIKGQHEGEEQWDNSESGRKRRGLCLRLFLQLVYPTSSFFPTILLIYFLSLFVSLLHLTLDFLFLTRYERVEGSDGKKYLRN
ncbi:hypothetical protein Pcinc_037983 [Petrolisthes cinctipes]|uniref:Transmembrane protein n=1 Tax=Petrolisthes cinctipes TaxID=88211 RepID=A0AAE1BVE2_PETCI|nr:hypothetical protein Pcinc_037983 [Petrolisthes cinctipes]